LPPGFGAEVGSVSAVGSGKIPPGLYIAFNNKPDDFFENHFEARVNGIFEVNFDGTNQQHADGKGLFGQPPEKVRKLAGLFVSKDQGQGNPNCPELVKGITENNLPIADEGFIQTGGDSYNLDSVTAIGLGCNVITDLIQFNVIAPNGTDINGNPPFVSSPTFIPDTNGKWVINMGVQVYAETRILTVTGSDKPTAITGPDQTVTEGALVTLDASDSIIPVPNPGADTYTWLLTFGGGFTGMLSDVNAEFPTFTAQDVGPEGKVFEFTVTVRDGNGVEDKSTVRITINDTIP